MRRTDRARLGVAGVLLALVAACGSSEPQAVVKSPASVRALRRAFDGAPPVIAHKNLGMSCTQCHNATGLEVGGLGYAPASPHEQTAGLSSLSNCRQCHVFKQTEELFVQNEFVGLRQDLRKGERLNPLAPPVRPHAAFMRENCQACHTGPGAREEIRCPHPERTRCIQCHVAQDNTAEYER
jgi:cytochrome c-type protein NapB